MNKTNLITKAAHFGASLIKKVDILPTHTRTVTGTMYSNGLQLIQGAIVPKCATKAQYSEYLFILTNKHNYSVKEAAAACNISVSYAYKLLRAK